MSLIHTSHSEKQRAARRANALRSTGPRSERGKQQSSLNALKFGYFARSHASMHQAFGEDPGEAARLREALIRGLRPTDEAQLMLVEDIAVLRLEKIRNQRAQEAVMLTNLQNLERQRRRQFIHLVDQRPDTPIADVHEHGLLRAPDSPGKFEQVQHILKAALDSLDAPMFLDEMQASFEILWGRNPSMRGQMIMNAYAELLEKSKRPGFQLISAAEQQRQAEEFERYEARQRAKARQIAQDDAESEGEEATDEEGEARDGAAASASPSDDPPDSQAIGDDEASAEEIEEESEADLSDASDADESDGEEGAASEEEELARIFGPYTADDHSPAAEAERRKVNNTYDLQRLRRALLEEQSLAFEQYRLYQEEQIELGAALRDSCLAPTEQTWRAIYRQEFAIDRQIERKMRLLMEMQEREVDSQQSTVGSRQRAVSSRQKAVGREEIEVRREEAKASPQHLAPSPEHPKPVFRQNEARRLLKIKAQGRSPRPGRGGQKSGGRTKAEARSE